MIDQGILYGYVQYTTPRVGLFAITGDKYELATGWQRIEKSLVIIGEDSTAYVEKLVETGHGEWVGETIVQYKYTLPVGVHKSRLIRWLDEPIQLTMFN